MRLAKHLAHAGVASRRGAEELIAQGRVRIDGELVRDPARDVHSQQRIEVDGQALAGPEGKVAYALNKPLGVVSTARDTHGRPTVVQLLPDAGVRLYPVGRLDIDTSGLILLTNDGELANLLTHPRYEVAKSYRARVGGGAVSERALGALRRGVRLADGDTAPARVRRLDAHTIELTIREGRNRQVRRMCESVGHSVQALERVAFGPVRLGVLAPGAHRRLRESELRALREAAAVPTAPRRG